MRRWERRRIAAVTLVVLPLAAAGFAQAPRTRAAPARNPILFVHGWQGDAGQWRTMMARFRSDGWSEAELFAWTFDDRQSNAAIAARISARIDQVLAATGASRVDVVTHSMGSLSTRYYLKNLARPGRVDAWASLGGPNHGTQAAWLCFSPACREMRPGSAFLTTLNRDDETPGAARYATWWSPCDEIVEPSSVALDGAENHPAPCVGHLGLLSDTAVYRQVRDFVSGPAILVHAQHPRSPLQDPGIGANAELTRPTRGEAAVSTARVAARPLPRRWRWRR
ncbi:MAG TPA: triacylglycerol lipase [Longimicrobium sp.]|nr:triacylglycerol lipase [Longimicrobium sp.]